MHDGREQVGPQRRFHVRVRECDERLVRPGSVCSPLRCYWSRTSLRLCGRSNKEKLVRAWLLCTGWCQCTWIACWFPQSLVIAWYFFYWFPRIYGDFAVFLSPFVCSSAILCPCRARSPRFSLVLERSVMLDWRRMPVSSGAVHRRHVFCSHGHVSGHVVLGGLPDALPEHKSTLPSTMSTTSPSCPSVRRRCQRMRTRRACLVSSVQDTICSRHISRCLFLSHNPCQFLW